MSSISSKSLNYKKKKQQNKKIIGTNLHTFHSNKQNVHTVKRQLKKLISQHQFLMLSSGECSV